LDLVVPEDDIPTLNLNVVFRTLTASIVLKHIGIYQEYLLVVDKYRGIHIFDNSDQQNSMRVAFLPIPGTTEISIQNGYLYTNSFMDLVSVNLQDIVDATYTSDSFSRNQDWFERPRIYEFLPDQYRFTNDYLIPDNEENDIVIGYVASGGEQVIYGDSHE
jgi:hypothetical protein